MLSWHMILKFPSLIIYKYRPHLFPCSFIFCFSFMEYLLILFLLLNPVLSTTRSCKDLTISCLPGLHHYSEVWSKDEQHQPHLGPCWNCRISGPSRTTESGSVLFFFYKISRAIVCMTKVWEALWECSHARWFTYWNSEKLHNILL